MKPSVLVTGASGLLGRAVYTELVQQPGWTVHGTSRSRDHGGKFKLTDLCDHNATKKLISELKPHCIVHCAAERRPDVMENNEAKSRKLNVDATKNLCESALNTGSWVIYISTDYVFDGKNPPYAETAGNVNPLNKYGKSKLDGEKACLGTSNKNAVLRVPVLYGTVESLSESAVTVLFEKVQQTGQKCLMSDYERRYPTHSHDLAVVIKQMIEKHQEGVDVSGHFHWSGKEEMTKYDMAVKMADLFDLPNDHIVADKTVSTGTTRPYNAALQCRRLNELGIEGQRTPFEIGIRQCLETWCKSHTGAVKVRIHTD